MRIVERKGLPLIYHGEVFWAMFVCMSVGFGVYVCIGLDGRFVHMYVCVYTSVWRLYAVRRTMQIDTQYQYL